MTGPDWDRALADIREAAETGRQPEGVQRERHERERAAVDAAIAEVEARRRRPWWRRWRREE